MELWLEIGWTRQKIHSDFLYEKRIISSTSTRNTAWKVFVFGVFLVRIFPHADRIRENTDQKNSEYGHFLRSAIMDISFYLLLFLSSIQVENLKHLCWTSKLKIRSDPCIYARYFLCRWMAPVLRCFISFGKY